MPNCRYDCGWAGKCKEPAKTDGFCEKHYGKKCASCGEVAVRECDQTGIQFVCGAPLCATCQHGIPEEGKEGWFNLGGGHVTKEVYEQSFAAQAAGTQMEPVDPPDSNMRKSTDATLVAALRILADDVQSGDGVANAAIAEAADRLEQLSTGPWFLLYSGTSEDGRGHPKFTRRTRDAQEAKKHWQECYENPYSTGNVVIVTDASETHGGRNTDWDRWI